MLGFFRKYQKIFFLFTTTVIIVSFSFFGTYGTFFSQAPNPVAFKTFDGQEIHERYVGAMMRFMNTDIQDLQNGRAAPVNVLNEGIIRKFFLENEMAFVLLEPFIQNMAPKLQAKLEKEARYTPFVHPRIPQVRADAVWRHFSPQILTELSSLQQSEKADMAYWRHKVDLYKAQTQFPASYLAKVLNYQIAGEGRQALSPQQTSLFGYHSLQDWFGEDFVRLACKFIIHAAGIARARGHFVSKEEATAQLLYSAHQAALVVGSSGREGFDFIGAHLSYLGIETAEAIAILQDVLLFKRLFDGATQSVVLDSLAFRQFEEFATQTASVEVHTVSNDFMLSDFHNLQLFEVYASILTGKGLLDFSLPKDVKPIGAIQALHPEMVQRPYRLRVSEVKRSDLRLKASFAEIALWQQQNKEQLQEAFPYLQRLGANQDLSRAIDSLGEQQRQEVEDFVRDRLIDDHPEWLLTALKSASPSEKNWALRVCGGSFPIEGVQDRLTFISLLDEALQDASSDATRQLQNYSADKRHFYAIEVLDKAPAEIVDFSCAVQQGLLQAFLDSCLKNQWKILCEKDPVSYLNADGSLRPFTEVKQKVAESFFAPLLQQIQQQAAVCGIVWEQSKERYLPDFCARLRFLPVVMDACGQKGDKTEGSAPWNTKVQTHQVARKQALIESKDLFDQPLQCLTGPALLAFGQPCFYQVLSHNKVAPKLDLVFQAQALVGREAEKYMLQVVLDRLAKDHLWPGEAEPSSL